MMNANAALQQYQQVHVQGAETANPHRLIQMLMDGALERIAAAKRHLANGEMAEKGEKISSAMSIIGGLQASLNLEEGGDIASNLDALYDYMTRRLLQANIQNDPEGLDEVGRLMATVKSGWDGIADHVNE